MSAQAQYASRDPHFVAYQPQPKAESSNLNSLSLEAFIQLAQQNALSAEAAKAELEVAKFNNKIFKSGLKPRLWGMANVPNFSNTFAEVLQDDGSVAFQSVTNNNSQVGFQLSQNVAATGGQVFASTGLQRFDNFNDDKRFYNGSPIQVGFWQPLFGFNELKWDKRIEPLRLAEAEKQYSTQVENIKVEASALFFNLLTANEDLKIAQSNKASNETIYEIAQEKFELGKISKSDLLALQLELVSAKAGEKQATQAVRTASRSIQTYLGKAYDGELIVPEIPKSEGSPFRGPGGEFVQKALANRPEPITYTRLLTEAERDVAEAKRTGGFQADLSASFGLSRGADNISDIYGDPQPQQFVELQLSVPILDWGRQKSRVGVAKAQRDFIQKSVAQQRLEFNATIEQAASDFQNLKQELELAAEVKDLAQQRFEITKKSFALGAISTTDLTLAQREKDRTQRVYALTLSRYWANYFLLSALIGG